MKRRTLLIMAIVCFIIAILSITGIIFEVRSCYAGQEHNHCLERVNNNNRQVYLIMNCAGESAHIYWATYDITYNHGSIKTNEGTHSSYFMRPENRPAKTDANGNLTPEWLRWLSQLNYTHMTMKGEKLVLLSSSGVNNVSRTEKSGRYYYYIWKDDARHDKYVQWCLKNGVKLGN